MMIQNITQINYKKWKLNKLDYKIKYTKQAVSELNKAYSWYRSKESDLGERFKNTFRKIKINLKENPKIGDVVNWCFQKKH